MIGIGATVGSGVFVLTGQIALCDAGAATVLSWVVAGVACMLSGFSYMEMSALVPSHGSTYAYAYHALGELPAYVAGFLLTLEYGVSSAAVAASWGIKLEEWLAGLFETSTFAGSDFKWIASPYGSIGGIAMMSLCVLILLCGSEMGKTAINVFTMAKISLVVFMIIVGFTAFDAANLTPFITPTATPPDVCLKTTESYGAFGIVAGATSSFFGYIGFDEVCCMASEVHNPARTLPLAVVGIVIGTMVLSGLASLSLTAMANPPLAPAEDAESYFASSFVWAYEQVGYGWAAEIISVGELITLTVVVLVGFVAQPRLQYAMAEDGLLPSIFAHVTEKGNLFWGTLLGGVMAVIIAGWVPFSYITDLISAGCLLSFQLTNTACVFVHADPTMAVEITTSAYDQVVLALEAEEGTIEDLTLDTLTRTASQDPGSGVFDRPVAGRSFSSSSSRRAGGSQSGYGAAETSEDAAFAGEGAPRQSRSGSARSREASDADDEGGVSEDEGYAPLRHADAEVLTIHVPTRSAWASATVRTLAVCFHVFALAAALISKPLLSRTVTLETRDEAERALHHTLVALTIATTLLAIACASLVCGFAWGWEALGNGGGGCSFWTDLPLVAVETIKDLGRCFAQFGGCCAACCCTSAVAAEAAAAAASAPGATRPSSLSAALMAEAHEGRSTAEADAGAPSGAAADVVPVAGGDAPRFVTPGGPLLPLIGSGFNWFLLAQLRWASMGLLVAYVAIAVLTYFVFGCVCAGTCVCAPPLRLRLRLASLLTQRPPATSLRSTPRCATSAAGTGAPCRERVHQWALARTSGRSTKS